MAEPKEQCAYIARYHIQHGVTQGLGVVYPDESIETREFAAPSTIAAIVLAAKYARHFANDYLSNPDTGKVSVDVQELRRKDCCVIDICSELEKLLPGGRFAEVKPRLFPDGAHLRVERTWLDHIISMAKEKEASCAH